mmetsp:Transcript_5393/g.7178  ORF Transcript_5393/g.7178 Transcript_5393/m.7178 type:complete len:193 (-) Transcript_5393:47-625(-)
MSFLKKENHGDTEAFSEKDDDGFDFGGGIKAIKERKKSSIPPVVPEKKRIVKKESKTGDKERNHKSKKRSKSKKRGKRNKEKGKEAVAGTAGIQPGADIRGLNAQNISGNVENRSKVEEPNLLISIFGSDENVMNTEDAQGVKPIELMEQLQVQNNASSSKRSSFDDFNPFEDVEKSNENSSNKTDDFNPFI